MHFSIRFIIPPGGATLIDRSTVQRKILHEGRKIRKFNVGYGDGRETL